MMSVLVAEDDELLRSLLIRVLESRGYSVLAAPDGDAAMKAAAGHAGGIDLLLTDVVMPRMGGRELSAALCNQRPALRVLFITGCVTESFDSRANVLAKPFTIAELLRRIEQTLAT